GCCANAWPLRAVFEGGVVSTSRVAAPAVPVAVNVTGLPASPVAVAVAVFCPAVALKVHDVAAAIPLAPVATGVVGVTVPLPVVAVLLLAVAPAGLGVAVTTTLLWLTGLPLASCSCTTGCCANGWPLCAVLEGGVVSASLVAAAALTLNGPLVTGVSGAELATRL